MNVSVVIPLYNAEKHIEKAIESCLQFLEVKEIVVIDDGYKDGAKQLVQNLAQNKPIIKLYEHPNNENRGAGESRNLGIKKATQEYIAFLDADDFFLPNRFDKDKEVFSKKPLADGCYNAIGVHYNSEKAKKENFHIFKNNLTTVNKEANPTEANLFEGLLGLIPNYGYFSIDGLTVKREFLIKNSLFFPTSSMHEDTDFFIRLSYYGKLYPSNIEEPVAMRVIHEENRIISNKKNTIFSQNKKRYLMWESLYNWGKKNKTPNKYINFIEKQKYHYYFSSFARPKSLVLVKETLKNPSLLKQKQYKFYHEKYYGKHRISRVFFKIIQLLVKLI